MAQALVVHDMLGMTHEFNPRFLRRYLDLHTEMTNAFKAYRREVVEGCKPFLAPHFNFTIELPLKSVVRGFSWTTMPITWRNRRTGIAKLKIREMGSRYFFIMMYVWLEKYFSRGDYEHHPEPVQEPSPDPKTEEKSGE